MTTWLKLIGTATSPVTEWKEDYVGFRKANKPSIRAGDDLILYAPGKKRIFALAKATSDPEHNPDYNPNKVGSCRWKVYVSYGHNCAVSSGVSITEVSSSRDLIRSLQQQSHIRLFPEEIESATNKLSKPKR